MNFSHVVNRYLNRLYKCTAILLVLFAVLISAFRLLLPYAEHYTHFFTHYINENYQRNITIGSMSLSWQKEGPTLVANDVRFLETQTVDVHIKNVDIRVNFWRSLTEQKLVAHHITLNGIKTVIDQTVKIASQEQATEQVLLDDTFDLFLNQIRRFSLTNSEIVLKQLNRNRHIFITQLNWKNDGLRHRASGDVKIGGLSENHLKLLLDITGDKRDDMVGQVYLSAQALNINPWLDRVFDAKGHDIQSDINFDAWLSIKQGVTSQVKVALGNNSIHWQDAANSHQVQVNAGHLVLDNILPSQGFTMSSSPLDISLNDKKWQPLTLTLTKTSDQLLSRVSSIDIHGLATIAPLLIDSDDTRQLLNTLAPTGTLDNVFVEYSDAGIKLVSNFNQVNVNFSQGIPGINNVSGHAVFADQRLFIDLLAINGALDFDDSFKKPIPYNTISANVTAAFNEAGVKVNVDQLTIASDELTMSSEVNVTVPKNAPTTMSLLASINNLDIAHINNYYPHLLMGEDLVNYLNKSLVTGRAKHAQVLFNGPFSSFPFTDHSGIFVVDAELVDSTFRFDENWPAINHFHANLNFTNNSMLITGRSGFLSGIDVTGVEAAINELKGNNILTVDAAINQALPKSVSALMLASPLADSVGATLEHLVIEQPINGDFHLMLPLKDIDAVVASGQINFQNNLATLQAPSMRFTDLTGQLTYRNDVIDANNLTMKWQGLPLDITVKAEQKTHAFQTDLSVIAQWPEATWQQHFPASLIKYQQGELNWQGKLSLYNHRGGNFSYQFNGDSDLRLMQFNLPKPYDKAMNQAADLTVSASGDLSRSKIAFSLDQQLHFLSELNHETVHFDRAQLTLGQEIMLLPMKGFHITTHLAYADVMEWQPYISDILDSLAEPDVNAAPSSPLFSAPERVRGMVEQLDVAGQQLTDVSFNFLDKENWRLLELNANETRSQLKIFPDWLEQGVEVNAEFLHLIPPVSDTENLSVKLNTFEENDAIFQQFPPLSFHCDSCKYGNLDLGNVDFVTERSAQNLITMKNVKAVRKGAALNFDLQWQHDQNGSTTKVIGQADIKDIESELSRFAFDSIIKESGFTANINAGWQGAPFEFSPALFNGKFSTEIDDGYLAEVGDKARLFSVLSLESLVRKLTLDFRDIFSDGMFYSSIEGDFTIKAGILYTDNTQMYGAAGDLVMKGNTNLVNGALDYSLSYKPNLTSSLPVLAWIATLQPTIFLASIAIDQVFTSQVVSEFTFELTGTVDNPDFKEVDRKTKDISVGKSTPPHFIDHNNKQPLDHNAAGIEPEVSGSINKASEQGGEKGIQKAIQKEKGKQKGDTSNNSETTAEPNITPLPKIQTKPEPKPEPEPKPTNESEIAPVIENSPTSIESNNG